MVGRVLAVGLLVTTIGATTMSQRVGHIYSNGNCAIGTNGQLTGKCVAAGHVNGSCVQRAPDPSSPACKVGAVTQRVRTPPCSPNEQPVSYDYTCFFLTP